MSCQTTEIPRGWEERGETTTQTMSEQRIGGAMGIKDRLGLAIDGRSADHHSLPGTYRRMSFFALPRVLHCGTLRRDLPTAQVGFDEALDDRVNLVGFPRTQLGYIRCSRRTFRDFEIT